MVTLEALEAAGRKTNPGFLLLTNLVCDHLAVLALPGTQAPTRDSLFSIAFPKWAE